MKREKEHRPFGEWFEAQFGKPPKRPSKDELRSARIVLQGLEEQERKAEEYDAHKRAALYAWQARLTLHEEKMIEDDQADQSLFSLLVDQLVNEPREWKQFLQRPLFERNKRLSKSAALIAAAFNAVDWNAVAKDKVLTKVLELADAVDAQWRTGSNLAATTLRWAVNNRALSKEKRTYLCTRCNRGIDGGVYHHCA